MSEKEESAPKAKGKADAASAEEQAALDHARANSPWASARQATEEELAAKRAEQAERGEAEAKAKKASRASSRPWNASDRRLKPDRLALAGKHPGWRPRFVADANVEERLRNGWSYAQRKHYGGVAQVAEGAGLGETSTIRRDGMVLMEIPEEVAQDREAYLHAFNELQLSASVDEAVEGGIYVKKDHGRFGKNRKAG